MLATPLSLFFLLLPPPFSPFRYGFSSVQVVTILGGKKEVFAFNGAGTPCSYVGWMNYDLLPSRLGDAEPGDEQCVDPGRAVRFKGTEIYPPPALRTGRKKAQ